MKKSKQETAQKTPATHPRQCYVIRHELNRGKLSYYARPMPRNLHAYRTTATTLRVLHLFSTISLPAHTQRDITDGIRIGAMRLGVHSARSFRYAPFPRLAHPHSSPPQCYALLIRRAGTSYTWWLYSHWTYIPNKKIIGCTKPSVPPQRVVLCPPRFSHNNKQSVLSPRLT